MAMHHGASAYAYQHGRHQNDKHAHTWDFINAPLAYQVFLGGALAQVAIGTDGVFPGSLVVVVAVALL